MFMKTAVMTSKTINGFNAMFKFVNVSDLKILVKSGLSGGTRILLHGLTLYKFLTCSAFARLFDSYTGMQLDILFLTV